MAAWSYDIVKGVLAVGKGSVSRDLIQQKARGGTDRLVEVELRDSTKTSISLSLPARKDC